MSCGGTFSSTWKSLQKTASSERFLFPGGLTAVIWTDFIQTIIMMVGATALMIIGKFGTTSRHKKGIKQLGDTECMGNPDLIL